MVFLWVPTQEVVFFVLLSVYSPELHLNTPWRGAQTHNTNTCRYAYDARPDTEELSFKAGDVLQEVAPSTAAGWLNLSNTRTGERGLGPDNYVKKVSE